MDSLINIKITFIEGKDLLAADPNGKSDPYVKVPPNQPNTYNIPKKGFKTKTIKKTLNPVWNESFILQCYPRIDSLKFEVYDYDFIGKDDFLGNGTISLEFLGGFDLKNPFVQEQNISLSMVKKDKKTKKEATLFKGSVKVKIEYSPKVVAPTPTTVMNNGFPQAPPDPNFVTPVRIALLPGSWIPINEEEVKVGLGWDFEQGNTFDLDASVSGFNSTNGLLENIYYSHLVGLSGSVQHHGDNVTGIGEGDDEVITVRLAKVPKNVASLAVTINSYRGQSISQVKSGFIRIFTKTFEIGKFVLTHLKDSVGLLLGLFERDMKTGRWYFRVMIDPIEGTVVTKSTSSIQSLLGSYGEEFSSQYNQVPKHPYPNEILFQPGNWIPVKCASTNIGLGWDIQRGYTYDLDASVISFDMNGNVAEIIYHKNTLSKNGSICHHGDNKTGAGEGDDEVITINFPKLPNFIDCMAVVINSFKGNNLVGAKSGFIRLFDSCGPIGCHILQMGCNSVGLLLGVFRLDHTTNQWLFQVMMEPIEGTEVTQSVNNVIFVLRNYVLAEQMAMQQQMETERKRKEEEDKKNSVPVESINANGPVTQQNAPVESVNLNPQPNPAPVESVNINAQSNPAPVENISQPSQPNTAAPIESVQISEATNQPNQGEATQENPQQQ